MDLRQRLKEETQSLHDKIDQASLLKKIMLQTITLSEYQQLMQTFYGFIAPCEAIIHKYPYQALIENRYKTSWLEKDLHSLELPKMRETGLLLCGDLPALNDDNDVLGYLYVMEGATLGGQVIAKMLNLQLHITPESGGRYFHGYGHETRQMWNQFCMLLHEISGNERQNRIIDSARATFELFHHWVERNTLSPALQVKEIVNE